MKNKMIEFWDFFSLLEEDMFYHLEDNPEFYAQEVNKEILKVHQDLVFDLSYEVKDSKRYFVISADGDYQLFSLVDQFCSLQPNLSFWNVIALRPRLYQKNQVIEVEGLKLDYDDIFFDYVEEDSGLHLDVYINGYDSDDNRYVHVYFILLDSLIGERDAVTMIASTNIFSYSVFDEESLYNIREIISIIDQHKKSCN
jgi:hypothetical protein